MFFKRLRKPQNSARPYIPCGHDMGGPRTWVVQMEGNAKQALETGRSRLMVTALIFALGFLVVTLRLGDLALMNERGPGNRAGGDSDMLPPVSQRADIVDRNGVILATSLPSESLAANPRQIRDPAYAAERLAAVLPDISRNEIETKLNLDRSFVWLNRHLEPREIAAVNNLGIPGLMFRPDERRIYPQGALTAHTVGFTDIDGKGLSGVERAFDEVLTSSELPVELALDVRLQYILNQELRRSMEEFSGIGAAGILMDAETGEVLAMSSLPDFDPNEAGQASGDARFNRATLGVYEMGSIFKIFTAALTLDSGAVSISTKYDTTDPIRIGRFAIRDYKPKKRRLSVPEIFMYSSNIGTVHMAMEAGTTTLKDYYRNLGLLQTARLEIREIGQPILPSTWREINTMTASYGHGLAVTPLQTARAVAAVVNGGELVPSTLLHRPIDQPVQSRRIFSRETSEAMRWMMRLVVQNGTGKKANAPGYLVGGKTGTADKLSPTGGYARDKRIASFAGAFPMDHPRYVILAMVDEPKGIKRTFGYATAGWVAAPIVGKAVQRMAPLLGIAPRAEDMREENPLLMQVNLEEENR